MKHFYYEIGALADNQGSRVDLLISPDNYDTRLSAVYRNIDWVKEQLEKGHITYDLEKAGRSGEDWILLIERDEPQIELGGTDFDKHVMRTLMHAKSSVAPDLLEQRLKTANFYHGFPVKL
ncbi:MAG: hypothetical protein A2912_02385 [Candidatus Buchananbacteria bacterium RIFCSPLOWO2_01_FULL_40_23b]|uniref:Uncharacterized protein n=1 Tax=Candidatus Buchananbacteria bacterium RIFCSPLOWO2_01_FULL_40_23b TaxID=1797544 RepID=A0A1G1YQB7_9BACT|nr:MAG: hypothetical protein A2912_02385 [Candidatus Buchananbacteria bacterium RIFCSPLOWO2_01_FULL_40_23b]